MVKNGGPCKLFAFFFFKAPFRSAKLYKSSRTGGISQNFKRGAKLAGGDEQAVNFIVDGNEIVLATKFITRKPSL